MSMWKLTFRGNRSIDGIPDSNSLYKALYNETQKKFTWKSPGKSEWESEMSSDSWSLLQVAATEGTSLESIPAIESLIGLLAASSFRRS